MVLPEFRQALRQVRSHVVGLDKKYIKAIAGIGIFPRQAVARRSSTRPVYNPLTHKITELPVSGTNVTGPGGEPPVNP